MNLSKNRAIARKFYHDVVKTGRQWSMEDLAGYLPQDHELRPGATDNFGKITISNLATWLALNTKRK